MRDLLQQVRAASDNGLYYIALFMALALPDICGALESSDGLATRSKYIDWFDRNVAPAYGGFFDGEACYLFRCSMLHQGTTQHPVSKYARILFLEPGSGGIIMHNNVLNDALNIDIQVFCEDVCSAVEAWLTGAEQSPEFQANEARFVKRFPTGLAPYIGEVPVIG